MRFRVTEKCKAKKQNKTLNTLKVSKTEEENLQ